MNATHKSTKPTGTTMVWDVFVRVFHWSLVGAVSLAALTGFVLGASWIDIHIWAGGVAAVLILSRTLWGFLGTTYARFSSFVTGPRTVLEHAQMLRAGDAPRHLGHNPLGALMILAIMLLVLAMALSGLIILGGVFKTGPLGFAISFDAGSSLSELHEVLAIGFLILISLHIGGAIYESRRSRENLPRSMVTGRKENRSNDHVSPPANARPVLMVAVVAAGLGFAAWGGTELASRPALGVPVVTLDPVYADECSACHMAFHPSLLPAKSWAYTMAHLDDHFGEDASLDIGTTEELALWLSENAGERFDTKPANVFMEVAPSAPGSIIKTPFWQRTHHHIDDAMFKRRPIYSNSNCAACHSDAESGRFYPANISIPQEEQQ